MPDSIMARIPTALNFLEATKFSIQASENALEAWMKCLSFGCDLVKNFQGAGAKLAQQFLSGTGSGSGAPVGRFAQLQQQSLEAYFKVFTDYALSNFRQLQNDRSAELAFIRLFTDPMPPQDWTVAYDDTCVLLDLPSLRCIDISAPVRHRLRNYTVVFAPRAGHHSNIAEKVALYLRDQGLTRMAVVEQKCADDIPLQVDGLPHAEDFAGQVKQYAKVLEQVMRRTGKPAHLIAVCQPGPLLMSTLLLNPHLARTFGSAGAPMHTEAEKGFLTDFARIMGERFIDKMMALFGRRVCADRRGCGRECYDGTLQVLGFYYLGMDQHVKNFKKLLADLKQGNTEAAERQKVFYQWYNTAHHFPADFIRDTYQKIFIRNELIRGKLTLGEKTIGIKDYPGSVPIWALGGKADSIAPPLQATGHLDLIDSVPEADKLNLICDGGHMGLFRSEAILATHYSQIARFLLERSDRDRT